jgi:hypothetical protein
MGSRAAGSRTLAPMHEARSPGAAPASERTARTCSAAAPRPARNCDLANGIARERRCTQAQKVSMLDHPVPRRPEEIGWQSLAAPD